MTDDARAIRALEDVAAVERVAPGLMRVVSFSDAYMVDARGAGCNCPDKTYNEPSRCKHELSALLAASERYPAPWDVTDDLSADNRDDPMLLADGGREIDWKVSCFHCGSNYTPKARKKPTECYECGSENINVRKFNDD